MVANLADFTHDGEVGEIRRDTWWHMLQTIVVKVQDAKVRTL